MKNSNLEDRLIVVSASQWMANYPWKGMVRSHEPCKFWWAPTISPEQLKLEGSNFACMQTMPSPNERMTNHP